VEKAGQTTSAGDVSGEDPANGSNGDDSGIDGGEIIFQNTSSQGSANGGGSRKSKKVGDNEKSSPQPQEGGKVVTNIINNVRCHISYPTINYCPKINNNNINNYIISSNNPGTDVEPTPQGNRETGSTAADMQFSQLSGLSYVKKQGGNGGQAPGVRGSFKGEEKRGQSSDPL
jgi:hypothetical protein